MNEEILLIVKALLNITDEEKDGIFNLYIGIVIQQILNYCNISSLPEELKYTAAQMVVDIVNEAGVKVKIMSGENVSSVGEDGRSVSFTSPADALKATTLADDRLSRLKELNKFKQLYKTGV